VQRRILIAIAACVSFATPACGGGEEVPSPPVVDTGIEAAADAESDSISIDAVSDALVDADADAAITKGKTAHGTVSGGAKMSSPGYSMVMTVGESPGGGVNMSSPSHKMRTGIVGVSQP
jgi:hypothetical protein